MCIRLVIVVLNLVLVAQSYKILALFPHPGKSHVDVFLPLMVAMTERGHEVTVASHYPLPAPIPRFTHVNLGDPNTQLVNNFSVFEIRSDRIGRWLHEGLLHHLGQSACKTAYESADFQAFMKKPHTFDLVIAEFFNSDCMLGSLYKFNAPPVIGISSCTLMPATNRRFANPTHPAYIPHNHMTYSDRMTFWERVENLVMGVVYEQFYERITAKSDQEMAEKYLGPGLPPIQDIVRNSSLLLVNSHHTLNLPRPLVPAVIEVGGIHIGKINRLPHNLEKWINESAHGVIYFSLGSMIKGHTFPDEKRREFLKAFGRLPQRVLWKWENESMPGKPDNVMIQKWMPQLDILCHPNVKAFISHGGLLGTTEAVHCGVPALLMPQFGDQHTNARAMEANGGGVILQLYDATEETIYNALKTILDPEFRRGAQELSARFRDRPLPPLETAIYWVEYVARHRGAHHMRTAAVDMPLYKYLLLDVIAFLLLVAGVVSALFFYVTRAVLKKLFGRRDKQKTN